MHENVSVTRTVTDSLSSELPESSMNSEIVVASLKLATCCEFVRKGRRALGRYHIHM